jgi:DNA-binding transcriptional MerR regulator
VKSEADRRPKAKRTRRTPLFNIGTAARLAGIPIWTLRWIEKQKLVSPGRSRGRQRLYSEEDMDTLERVRRLMKEKVNAAGIRVILRMKVRGAF